jgi:hypothetical protein
MQKSDKDSIEEILMALGEQMKESEAEARRKCQEILKNGFFHIFANFPEIKAISWTQYTPYFNDGEECVFSVGDFSVSLVDVSIEDGEGMSHFDDSAGWYSSWGAKYAADQGQLERDVADRLQKATRFLRDNFSNHFLMKGTFGDHVSVIARPDGNFQVMEYDHE